MQIFFSPESISAWDFVSVSVTFVLCMAVFFTLKDARHWLNWLFVGVLILHCVTALAFKPLPTKLFTLLTLISVVVVEAVAGRRWRAGREGSGADGRGVA